LAEREEMAGLVEECQEKDDPPRSYPADNRSRDGETAQTIRNHASMVFQAAATSGSNIRNLSI